jgi:hypothetical protein
MILGLFTQFRVMAIGIVVALAVGAGGGWKLRDKLCDAAANAAQLDWLHRELEARTASEQVNRELHDEHAAEIAKLEEAANALTGKISDGPCFTESDVRILRQLWPGTK